MSLQASFHNVSSVSYYLFEQSSPADAETFVNLMIKDEKGNFINIFIRDREVLGEIVRTAMKAYDALSDSQDGFPSEVVVPTGMEPLFLT